jgi:D-aspartate ligase
VTAAAPARSPAGELFLPVILGADTGVYALARSFHEAFGAKAVVVSMIVTGPVADSSILENVVVGADATPDDLVAALRDVANRFSGVRLLLLANTDWLIRFLVARREALSAWYTVPVIEPGLLARVADKVEFARLCEANDVPTPRTVVQDFSGADRSDWAPSPVDFAFPVIAKAANSADYERLHFPGKKKVYQADDAAGLDRILRVVAAGGFRGQFVVQEMIPGDDTAMRSLTMYVDRRGVITLECTAHVLLEEHTPSGLGNPAAMITGRDESLLAPARRILLASGYRGFANFDVKVDPRDGTPRFLEVNPRIGRNNYYVTAAGANPMRFLVADQIDGVAVEPVSVERRVLYSIVPLRMLARYVRDPGLRALVSRLIRSRATAHPLRYRAERGIRRRLYVAAATLNQRRKFRRYYPKPTDTGL